MEHVGHPAVRRRLPRGLEPEDRDLGGGRIVDRRAVGGQQVRRDALRVDGPPATQRAASSDPAPSASVGEQGHRPLLRSDPRGPELGVADDLVGGVGVDEGVLEEAELELEAEQPAGRLVEARFGDAPGLDEPDDGLGAVLAAELVDAGVDELDEPLLRGQVFDAPGLRPAEVAEVAELAGTSALSLTSPQSVQTIPSKPSCSRRMPVTTPRLKLKPDLLEVGPDRHGVVRHDLAGPGGDGGPERLAGGSRGCRPGRSAPGPRGSGDRRRPSAVRRPGSAWSSSTPTSRRSRCPGSRGCRR